MQLIKMLFAVPDTLREAKVAIETAIDHFNRNVAEAIGYRFQAVDSATIFPTGTHFSSHDLTQRIKDCGIFLGVLWVDLAPGGPVRADGLEAWFKYSYNHFKEHGRPHLMFYINTAEQSMSVMKATVEAAKKLLWITEFRDKLENILKIGPFENPSQLGTMLETDLRHVIDNLKSLVEPTSSADVGLEPELKRRLEDKCHLCLESKLIFGPPSILNALLGTSDFAAILGRDPLATRSALQNLLDEHERRSRDLTGPGVDPENIEDLTLIRDAREFAYNDRKKSHATAFHLWRVFLNTSTACRSLRDIGSAEKLLDTLKQQLQDGPKIEVLPGRSPQGESTAAIPISISEDQLDEPPAKFEPLELKTKLILEIPKKNIPDHILSGLSLDESSVFKKIIEGLRIMDEIIFETGMDRERIFDVVSRLRKMKLVSWRATAKEIKFK